MGILRIDDVANVHSCVSIQTADLGRVHEDESVVLLGRVPGAGPARVIAGADHFSMLTDRAHARAGGWWGELAATLVAP